MQYEPDVHASQAVEPELLWNFPAAHFSHTAWPGLEVNVPGAHGVTAVLPTPQEAPAGQITHSEALLKSVDTPFAVPAGHGKGFALPLGQ